MESLIWEGLKTATTFVTFFGKQKQSKGSQSQLIHVNIVCLYAIKL